MHTTRWFILVCLSLLVTLSLTGCVYQPDSGLWRGSVVVREEGRPAEICELEIDLSHTDDSLTIHHVNTTCRFYSAKWHVGTFFVDNGAIWRDGQNLGWDNDQGASLELSDRVADERHPLSAQSTSFTWQRVGDGLEFAEETRFSRFSVRRSSGLLSRVR